MQIANTNSKYGIISQFLHWLIFLLIIVMIPLGYFMDDVSDKALRGDVINLHKLIGISILILMLFRAAWSWINVKPAMPVGTPWWQSVIERWGHRFIYVLLIAMPLVGWIGSVAEGYVPHLFSWQLNLPIQKSEAVGALCFNLHNTLAIIIIVVISLHIVAALYHHFIKKDGVLRRMLP